MKKNYYLVILGLILFFGALLRFVYLDRIPIGISDDELDTVLTARSIYYTGKTLEGIYSPFFFHSVPPNTLVPFARAPYMLLTPFSGLFQYGLGWSKVPFGVISILTIIVITCITWLLWGKRTGMYTAFVVSVSPWSIYFGRTAFDTPLSIFFIYVFLLCLLSLRRWWLLLAYIPWFIGLYSYEGMIMLYPLVLVVGIIGIWKLRGHVYRRQYIVLAVMGVLTFSLFMRAFWGDRAGTRTNEIISPNNPSIISQVNSDRRSAVQEPINSLFINKFTRYAWDVAGKYIGAFSSTDLFVSGESRSTFSLWTHGFFYPLEFFLLLLGLFQAYRLDRRKTIFLLCLVAIAPMPAALSLVGTSYALRASFMYPLFWIFIGVGIAFLFEMSKRRYIKTGIAILYVLAIMNFIHIYFIQNPVMNSEGFGYSNRILSRYISLAVASNTPVLYVGNNVVNTYRQYIFYNNFITHISISNIQEAIRTHTFIIGSAQFIECPTGRASISANSTLITPYGKTCPSLAQYKKNSTPVVIAQLSDSGRIFEIYNDTVCAKFSLSEYQPMISFQDLDVEDMSAEKFCTTYISKPNPPIEEPSVANPPL